LWNTPARNDRGGTLNEPPPSASLSSDPPGLERRRPICPGTAGAPGVRWVAPPGPPQTWSASEKGICCKFLRLIAGEPVDWVSRVHFFALYGDRIFFMGRLDLGELVRYDAKSDAWIPFPGGMAATQLDYSRGAKWVTYIYRLSAWFGLAECLGRNRPVTTDRASACCRQPPRVGGRRPYHFFRIGAGKPSRIYVV